MPCALARRVGTTVSARKLGGIPEEKSSRGSGRGVASNVDNQFTSATANWLAHSAATTPLAASSAPCTPPAVSTASRHHVNIAVSRAIAPRYSGKGKRRLVRRAASNADQRI